MSIAHAAIASICIAANPPAPPTAAEDATPNAPAERLLGPAIDGGATGIVERDILGKVRRHNAHPALVAAEALRLDDRSAELVEAEFARRAAALDRVVRRQLDDLRVINVAKASGDTETYTRLGMDILSNFRSNYGAETISQRIRAVLPPRLAAEHERIENEYWDALIAEDLGDDASSFERFAHKPKLAIDFFTQDMFASWNRVTDILRKTRADVDRLCRHVQPSPAQEETMRDLALLYYRDTLLLPTLDQETELLMTMHDLLDPPQQRRFLEALLTMDFGFHGAAWRSRLFQPGEATATAER